MADNKPNAPEYPTAPPTYNEAAAAPAHTPIIYPPQTVTVQHMQQAPVTQVILVTGTKVAPCYEPYTEHCIRCDKQVQTRVEYVMGFCSWTMLFLGIFIFCPLLCCFCCDSFKDARHSCPNCGTVLSVKHR